MHAEDWPSTGHRTAINPESFRIFMSLARAKQHPLFVFR
jgi:hypothetical protein